MFTNKAIWASQRIWIGVVLIALAALQHPAHAINEFNYTFISDFPTGCDTEAAAACEYEFTTCRLFSGPVDDPDTLCKLWRRILWKLLEKSRM